MKNRNWRRVESDRGSVFLEYAIVASLMTLVAIAAFLPTNDNWAGTYFCEDYLIRDFLIKLPFF